MTINDLTAQDWVSFGVWTVLVFAVAYTIGSVRGYSRGVDWATKFWRGKT